MSKRRQRRHNAAKATATAPDTTTAAPSVDITPKPAPPLTVYPKPAPPRNAPVQPARTASTSRDASKRDVTKRDASKRDGSKRDGSKRAKNPSKTVSTVDTSGAKPFIGSRTTKRRREELPTDWPSKPNPRDNYEWFATGDSSTIGEVRASGTTVYVPIPAATGLFRDRCAIIGTAQGDGSILVDVEDGRYAPAPFADLVERAYGRHSTNYPTVARMVLDASLLVAVGSFDPDLGIVTIDDVDSFAGWTGVRSSELVTSDGLPARRRQWAEFLEQRPDVAHVPALRRQYARHFHLES